MCLLMHCISSERPLCCTRWIQAVRTHLSPCAFCCLMLAKCWLSLLIDSPDWPQLTVVRQVEREVAILRQLHHENLVGCLFVADQGNKLSIVMDWAGDSLRTHRTLTQPQQYNEAVARHMVYQLTHALVYLHQKVKRTDLNTHFIFMTNSRPLLACIALHISVDPCRTAASSRLHHSSFVCPLS
eukprot:GHUV01043750.1.p1 GENE.GHUV01043750.1~~GHUV01043750.1.p1  ORF type:complete len:184 (-),score=0.17 GHUV01043750.1:332-883(-)